MQLTQGGIVFDLGFKAASQESEKKAMKCLESVALAADACSVFGSTMPPGILNASRQAAAWSSAYAAAPAARLHDLEWASEIYQDAARLTGQCHEAAMAVLHAFNLEPEQAAQRAAMALLVEAWDPSWDPSPSQIFGGPGKEAKMREIRERQIWITYTLRLAREMALKAMAK